MKTMHEITVNALYDFLDGVNASDKWSNRIRYNVSNNASRVFIDGTLVKGLSKSEIYDLYRKVAFKLDNDSFLAEYLVRRWKSI